MLSLVDVPDEAPGPGQIAVEVRGAGVNPVDAKLHGGLYGTSAPLPRATAGCDRRRHRHGRRRPGDRCVARARHRSRSHRTIAGFARGFAEGIKVLGGAPGADAGTEIRDAARLELVDLVAAGKLSVAVAATYPFTQATDAHRAISTGHTTGKIVLVP